MNTPYPSPIINTGSFSLLLRRVAAGFAIVALLCAAGFSASTTAHAEENDGTLATKLVAQNAEVFAGDRLVYEAQLSCSDPAQCQQVTLHFSKPNSASGPGAVGRPYPEGVTAVTQLPDGSLDVQYSATRAGLTTQLTISWPTQNYTSPPGEQTAVMSVSSPTIPSYDRSATITLIAESDLTLTKDGASQAVPGEEYKYVINYGLTYPDPAEHHGGRGYTGVVMTDVLPDGLTFVEANGGGVYDPVTRTISWNIGDLQGSATVAVTVKFDGSLLGETVTNTAVISGVPLGETNQVSVSDSAETLVTDEASPVDIWGSKLGTPVIVGSEQSWELQTTNNSSVSKTVLITDTMPVGLDLIRVDPGYYSSSIPPGSTVEFFYQNGTSSGPLAFNPTTSLVVPDQSSRVDRVAVRFPLIRANGNVSLNLFSMPNAADLAGLKDLTNCATITDEAQESPQHPCATVGVSQVPIPEVSIAKTVDQAPVAPGGTHTWNLALRAEANQAAWTPDVWDAVPGTLNYVAGSFRADPANADYCLAASDFAETITPNYEYGDHVGARAVTMVRWTAVGDASISFPSSGAESCQYQYDTTVNPGVAAGVYGGNSGAAGYNGNTAYAFDRDLRLPNGMAGWLADAEDVNGNGDVRELVQRSASSFSVATSSAALIEKFVTGDQDSGQWFASAEIAGNAGEIGTSTPGGTVSYRVKMGNLGNKDLRNVVAYDILPAPGSPGVTNGRYKQSPVAGNQWRPTMTGPIDTGGAPVNITYSTLDDPCRPEMDNSMNHSASFWCGGAQDTSWQQANEVTDWSSIRSIRFDFGSTVFAGGDSYELSWAMQAPTKLGDGSDILGGETTWNRVAIQAKQAADGTDILAAEAPWVVDRMKVGAGPLPADSFAIGDIAWIDANADGVQNSGEKSLAGVRVQLLDEHGKQAVDLSGEPIADVFTDAEGRYHFDQLPAGSYRVKFTAPNGYKLTRATLGSDAESDSNPNQASGITDVIHLGLGLGQTSASRRSDNVLAPYIDRTIDAGFVVSTPETQQGRVRIVKDDGRTLVRPGEELTYTLTVTNYTSQIAPKVVVRDELPANVRFVTSSIVGTVSLDNPRAFEWSLGNMKPGDTKVVTVTVTVDAGLAGNTEIVNTARVTTDGICSNDPEQPGNECTSVDIDRTTDGLWVTKDDGKTQVEPGETLVYALTAGNAAAEGTIDRATVTDELPSNVTFVSATDGGKLSDDGTRVVWNLGSLAAGSSRTVYVTVRVNESARPGETVKNRAFVAAPQADCSATSEDSCVDTDTDQLAVLAVTGGQQFTPLLTLVLLLVVTGAFLFWLQRRRKDGRDEVSAGSRISL